MKEPPLTAAEAPPSKSERKRQADALFALGRRLVELPAGRLERLPLPANVRAAVLEAQATGARVARKRQLKFLAKQLRSIDPAPIESALAAAQRERRGEIGREHLIERWREALLAEGDRALQRLLAHDPGIEQQRLRQLMRQAGLQERRGKPPRAARELFRALRKIELESGLPEVS